MERVFVDGLTSHWVVETPVIDYLLSACISTGHNANLVDAIVEKISSWVHTLMAVQLVSSICGGDSWVGQPFRCD